jgi:hypothetical protein
MAIGHVEIRVHGAPRAARPVPKKVPKEFKILVGQHQKGDGRLTVLRDYGSNRFHKHIWLCRCDCGGRAVVSTSHFLSGHTKSCGCLQREIAAKIGKRRCRFPRQVRTNHQFERMAHQMYQCYLRGATLNEVGFQFGCRPAHAVWYIFRRRGWEMRSRSRTGTLGPVGD